MSFPVDSSEFDADHAHSEIEGPAWIHCLRGLFKLGFLRRQIAKNDAFLSFVLGRNYT
jgi:hypothetical protein